MESLKVNRVEYEGNCQCWGCISRGLNKKYVQVFTGMFNTSICMECYNRNIDCKLMKCVDCNNNFLLDITKIKINDVIKYGFNEFVLCYKCLMENINGVKESNICHQGYLRRLDYEQATFDDFKEQYEEVEYKCLEDKKIRVIGEIKYENNYKKELENIKKKINNCKNNDKKNLIL
jgi:hypothetical protein